MADKKAVMEKFLATITPLGPARAKAMFGGYGVFLDDQMFAKISSKGVVALKADKENLPAFEAAGFAFVPCCSCRGSHSWESQIVNWDQLITF